MEDFLSAIVLILCCAAIMVPAKVEVTNGMVHFSVWPYFTKEPKPVSQIEYYKVRMGWHPVYIKFKDGTVFKWTSYPLHKHKRLNEILESAIKNETTKNA